MEVFAKLMGWKEFTQHLPVLIVFFLVGVGALVFSVMYVIKGYNKFLGLVQEVVTASLVTHRADTRHMLQAELDAHRHDEMVWQQKIHDGQEELRTIVTEVRSDVRALQTDMQTLRQLVDGMERERAARHDLEDIARRQVENLMKKG